MKVSYKVIKKYIPWVKPVEELAQDLIMHTAEVEDILLEWENLKDVYIWQIKEVKKHPDSEKLNCTIVEVNWENFPIVCWANNVKEWLKVPVAVCWAKLAENFVITKTKIRWESSQWMICSEDELWLIEERQKWILELPEHAPMNVSMRDYLEKNDVILEIDNKAINHRPDLFSHIWIIREIYAINWKKFNFEYAKKDFSNLEDLKIKNEIPEVVSRYKWLKIENVENIESPDYIKQVLASAWVNSKWLLIDISNYSLYLYWQPTHCFDADKITWNIVVRFAKNWEKFLALDDKEYELTTEDIVICDDNWVIALGWIIWWKESSVWENTKNIIVESAHFDQAVVRKTWKRLWIRTDALNIFEKDITNWIQHSGMSLIAEELEKHFENIKLVAYSDIYPKKQEQITIPFDIEFINNLIWSNYSKEEALKILSNLWIEEKDNTLIIPFWRKDLNYKADIAEEIARIDGYDKIESTIPRINIWAVMQDNIYKLKNDARDFFTSIWYYDMYTYSFVNEELMQKLNSNTDNLVDLKNALSEEITHLRWNLIPNLLLSLEKNIKEYEKLKLFEIEKVFEKKDDNIKEYYSLSWVQTSTKDVIYYDIQNTITNFFKTIWLDNFAFDYEDNCPKYAHSWRTARIIVRGKKVWIIWEIHPQVAQNFDIKDKIWFFEINVDLIKNALYKITKAKDVSNFQENNFDLNFIVDKDVKANIIHQTIQNTDKNIINKVNLIDIYENEEKLAWKRSLTFKIFIQSLEKTLDDKDKAKLIEKIIAKVEKKWGKLR